jgi:TonB family protein
MRRVPRVVSLVALLAAGLAAVAPARERPTLLTVATSEDHAVEGGSWNSLLKRTAEPWACGVRAAQRCVENTVIIDNQSPQTLECTAAFATRAGTTPSLDGADQPALVLPRTLHEIRGPIVTAETTVELSHLECRARPPYQRLKIAAGCRYEMFGEPFESYYPAAAVTQALEGPVVVAFTLPERRGRATDVAVADSSLVYALDEAAKRFVKEQRFTTNCAGTRFDVRMRFTLRDRYLDGPTL